jgi:hypothetical protein
MNTSLLDRRLSEHAADPDDVVPWSEVKDSAALKMGAIAA